MATDLPIYAYFYVSASELPACNDQIKGKLVFYPLRMNLSIARALVGTSFLIKSMRFEMPMETNVQELLVLSLILLRIIFQ